MKRDANVTKEALARTALLFDLHGTLGAPFRRADSRGRNLLPRLLLVPDGGGGDSARKSGRLPHNRHHQPESDSRCWFTLDAFWSRMGELEAELKEKDVDLDAVYCCPHRAKDECACYKPRTALVEDACRVFDIDLRASFVVGDRGDLDILLAAAIGARS